MLLPLALAVGRGFFGWIILVTHTITVDTVGEVDFDTPLAVPPPAASRLVNSERVLDLELDEGTSDFGRGATPTW